MKTADSATRPPRRVGTHAAGAISRKWAWHFRTLLALRDHLARDAGERLCETSDAMEPPSLHAEDWADELYDRELAGALPAGERDARREVEDALHRLRSGTYGRCEKTGRPIPAAELRAMPWRRTSAAAEPRARPRPDRITSHAKSKTTAALGRLGLSAGRVSGEHSR